MKDIKVQCFYDVFLEELTSWWNWKKYLTHLPKDVWEANVFGLFCSCDTLLRLGTSQGYYTKEQVFDMCLNDLNPEAFLVKEKVDLKELKEEFFKNSTK